MRQVAVTEGDKVEAQARLGFAVNGYGVNELVERVGGRAGRDVDELVEAYEGELRRRGRAATRRAIATPSCGPPPASRAACGPSSRTAASAPSPTRSRTSAALEQLPGIGVQRLMADGYGFGAEGDWKAAALVRILKVMGDGLPGGTSFMEDYTYHLGDPVPEVLGAHMLEVCPSLAADRPSCEIHPLSIGGKSDPVRLVFDASPGPARHPRAGRPGRPLPADRERGRHRRPRTRRCRSCRSPARSGDRGPSLATAAEAWLTAGGPHHTALTTSLGIEALSDFADIADIELVTIDASTSSPAFKRELRWNQAYYYLNRGP